MRVTLFRSFDGIDHGEPYMITETIPIAGTRLANEPKTAFAGRKVQRPFVEGDDDSQQLELFDSNQFHRKPRRPHNRRKQ